MWPSMWLYVSLISPDGKGGYFVPPDVAEGLLGVLPEGWTIDSGNRRNEIKEYPVKIPDLGDDKERLEAVNNYFGECYTDWSQITWEQLKWFLNTLMLHREVNDE